MALRVAGGRPRRAQSRHLVGILGAGRQALETSGYCREEGLEIAFFLEERAPEYPRDLAQFDAPILTFNDDLDTWATTPVIASVGSPALRRRLVERWCKGRFQTVVSSHAWAAQDVIIGTGVTVAPRVSLNRLVRVGDHVLLNVGAILSHDVTVEDFATLSPGCAIGGGAVIRAAAFIGIGATVRDHVVIGSGAVVAAGAVVVDDVPDAATVMGVPARRVVLDAIQ